MNEELLRLLRDLLANQVPQDTPRNLEQELLGLLTNSGAFNVAPDDPSNAQRNSNVATTQDDPMQLLFSMLR